jgi:hypothetical protein
MLDIYADVAVHINAGHLSYQDMVALGGRIRSAGYQHVQIGARLAKVDKKRNDLTVMGRLVERIDEHVAASERANSGDEKASEVGYG